MILTAIPTRDRFDLLEPLLLSLFGGAGPGDVVLVMDNGYNIENRQALERMAAVEPMLMIANAEGQSIYEMWNFAIDFANEIEADYLLLLNDDVTAPSYLSTALAKTLEADPSIWAISPNYNQMPSLGTHVVHGTYSSGGMAGFAFMFSPSRPLRFDEGYTWWYGDDDFVNQVEAHGGKVAILTSVEIEHIGTATGVNYPELADRVAEDRKLYESKWITPSSGTPTGSITVDK